MGEAVLPDSVLRVQQAASIMGIRGILMHAISPKAQAFYEHHAFIPSANHPLMLIQSVTAGPAE
ncbi:MAG: hypothetical protein QM617_04590 [Comamonas sp.]